jgi:hypothetical protein
VTGDDQVGTVVIEGSRKALTLFGLLSLLLLVACESVTGAPGNSARSLAQPAAPVPAPTVMARSGELPANICGYMFLHQARQESLAFHTMAGVTACP